MELVAAFRATLEEVLEADVILHVRDAAHDESDAQRKDVLKVLHELGVHEDERVVVEVLNKIDLLESDVAKAMVVRNRVRTAMLTGHQIAVSALTGAGLDDLLLLIDRLLGSHEQTLRLALAPEDGAGLAWAYENGRVLERRSGGERDVSRDRRRRGHCGAIRSALPGADHDYRRKPAA